ncbi:MAG: hypothetical protein Q7Q73_15870 [Verrucomicrobiota bacterium JB024]|nr:hypothetical protein [Verrucomicrobiota bacterium JB024]
MHEQELDQALTQIRNEPLPRCPTVVETNVLRRIRQEKEAQSPVWLAWPASILSAPAALAAVIALFAIVSAVITATSATAYASHNERQIAATRALDFDFVKQTELVKFER